MKSHYFSGDKYFVILKETIIKIINLSIFKEKNIIPTKN